MGIKRPKVLDKRFALTPAMERVTERRTDLSGFATTADMVRDDMNTKLPTDPTLRKIIIGADPDARAIAAAPARFRIGAAAAGDALEALRAENAAPATEGTLADREWRSVVTAEGEERAARETPRRFRPWAVRQIARIVYGAATPDAARAAVGRTIAAAVEAAKEAAK